MGGGYSTR